jgi:hypothetical protein
MERQTEILGLRELAKMERQTEVFGLSMWGLGLVTMPWTSRLDVSADEEKGPIGYLYHLSSHLVVHPQIEINGGGRQFFYRLMQKLIDPDRPYPFSGSGTPLTLSKNVQPDPVQDAVRFVPVPIYKAGHFGFIQHVSSGKIVHPHHGKIKPDGDTHLVFHPHKHAGALFAFDEENMHIVHKSGLIWYPKGDRAANPRDGTAIILCNERNDAAKFYLGDEKGNPIPPYPPVHRDDIDSNWKVVKAFLSPLAAHSFTVKYKTGRMQTKSESTHNVWKISGNVGFKCFKELGGEYSELLDKLDSTTWSEEREETSTIEVIPPSNGQTSPASVVVWQYVFFASQYNEEFSFQSPLIADTNSLNKRPPHPKGLGK